MASAQSNETTLWQPERRPWGPTDALALLVWTAAIAAFFWDVVSLHKALFYFDITEINYPYRHFFASELRAGRFSRWCPSLYCGMPLYSESQAGYLHPLKYLLYPWLQTWQAFNLDTILSIWLTGLGTFGWLRRHVGPAGALAGAAVFGLGGFVWAHLIHTSMTNALTSIPFVIWSLEAAWDRASLKPLLGGAVAVSCQVFAGHLQDTILTAGIVGLYGLYRAVTERTWRQRKTAVAMSIGLVGLGIALSAVQWVPSKELLDRSPRAGGLEWKDLTYGSWHPELLPSLLVREAYGTRARDTDWMDGFYPYHEMNAYLGMIAMALAIVGAAGYRDRWVAFWVLLLATGSILMLGRYTFLFDYAHRIPIVGSSRIPVRFHLWVSLATAALAAVGVDRLSRPGQVRLRYAIMTILVLIVASLPILAFVYLPAWTEAKRWTLPYHLARFRWLSHELSVASVRTVVLVLVALGGAVAAARTATPARRRRFAACLPLLIIADLLGAHWVDVPTVAPEFWTEPPPTVAKLKSDPTLVRIFGIPEQSAGEPGYASEPVNFFAVRNALGWSLAPVWGLSSARGETPIIPRRIVDYYEAVLQDQGRFDIESVSHFLTGSSGIREFSSGPSANRTAIGANRTRRPRVRLEGKPYYASDKAAAIKAAQALGVHLKERLLVEDPDRPLKENAEVAGTAEITREIPERVEVAVSAETDAYLVLADTYDPGWWATVDGKPAQIRPAYLAFRAVYVPKGRHTVVFRYRPAGFRVGLAISLLSLAVALFLFVRPIKFDPFEPEHGSSRWRSSWPLWGAGLLAVIVITSAIQIDASGNVSLHARFLRSFHRFTWGAGIEAIERPADRATPE